MKHSTTLRMGKAWLLACLAILLTSSGAMAQVLRPNLGTASTYAVFTGAGSIISTGISVLTGDVGWNTLGPLTGFPPSTYTGTYNHGNAATAQALTDLGAAQTADGSVACGTVIGVGIVDGQSFDPGKYCSGGASTTSGTITFNAHGNGNAIFIVDIGGALAANAGTHIVLANNARAANIYWFVNGAVAVADGSSFAGTIIANGAIHFYGTSSLNGRALASPAGDISLVNNNMSISTDTGSVVNNLTVTKPALGDSILSGTLYDTIKWTGTGIALGKTIQYSLDSGRTWTTIATIDTASFAYLWNVPDTTSTKAFVRVTDSNNLRGVSGVFKIILNKIIVIAPAAGAVIAEGTQHDTIKWSGTGIDSIKTFAYSLDSGRTWITIGKDTTNGFTYLWNVPDTVSSKALVRIIDMNADTGKSGLFTIRSNKIIVLRPAGGEMVVEGKQNYQIMWSWTGTGLSPQKTFSLSLDSGATWTTIGKDTTNGFTFSWNVPNSISTRAMIRIADLNGDTGTSGMFTIHSNQITVTTPTSGEVIAEGTQNFQVTWTGVGIGAQKTIALSLNGGQTWDTIGTMTANVFSYYWAVPDTTSTTAIIRITDTNGMSGQSGVFTIKSNSALVVVNPALGAVIAEGLQNYQITWTGIGLAALKTFELSLDGGSTWSPIGTITTNGFTYSWNVPNTASTQAMISITDGNGVTGESGLFTIKANAGTIVISDPAAGEDVDGGRVNYPINWTATNVTAPLTLDYSLDGGLHWTLIGVTSTEGALSYLWALVPNVATTQALVRITDANRVTGISGLFTITTVKDKGTMNTLTLSGLDSNSNIGNDQNLEITWTFTPPIGTSVDVEYSLDYTTTWQPIATVPVTESSNSNSTAWQTTATGYYNPVFIKVTSSLGMTLTSIPFSIGTAPSSVGSNTVGNEYSISNYPNPASEQTTINFELPVRSDVKLVVCDNLGRTVDEATGTFDAGTHTIPVNTSQLTNGIYSYTLIAGSTRLSGRMNVVR
ncbi:MAG TPA: ice-binding family protein [Candidatus Kapabacteria bacterium]|nr:ice-binding family protein [Candidatus Kapabacteria bacterium]